MNADDRVTSEAGKGEKRPYDAPSLVRYGPLFVNTGAKACSEAKQAGDLSANQTDLCNPPDSPDTGGKADTGNIPSGDQGPHVDP